MEADALLAHAETLRRRGDDDAALDAYRRAAEAARARFAPDVEAAARLGEGELLALADRVGAARTAFEEAVARAMEGGALLVEADAWFALASLAFDQGRSKDGHDALLEAMALYRDQDSAEGKQKLARAVRVYGEHIGVLGSEDDAKQALELARVMHADLGDEAAVRAIAEDLLKLREYSR